ncbi:hypothetical protein [Hymenobacter sp. DG25A]|uniref:hypothetical protein n=1 Tax=Hymenobacter sp. DG25A TaxID=1385663 RepID=UPI0006BD9435|nr:hypothetical protein [Hymenobacter sp. DG25A]ALD20517.1 hypothetical protein AM218_03890 [Hymenobacter sp. DG25A]
MIYSKTRIIAFIFYIILLASAVVITIIFSVLINEHSSTQKSYLAPALFCLLAAALAIYSFLISINSIQIDTQKGIIVINKYFTIKTIINSGNSLGYKSHTHQTRFNSYRTFFIQTTDGTQYSLNEFQIKNFDLIKENLSAIIPYNEDLDKKIWLPGDKSSAWLTAVLIAFIHLTVTILEI